MQNIRYILVVLFSVCLVFLFACDESLPPRNDPTKLLQASLDVKYSLSFYENVLRIGVRVVNIYDETIQAETSISGTIEVHLIRNPVYRKTINLNYNNLVSTKLYNPSTRVLTIDPGDSIRFLYVWNFVDDNNVNLTEDVFQYYGDQNCSLRGISYAESFVISGSIQIIAKLGSTQLNPKIFNLCHISNYVLPKYCSAPPTTCYERR